MIQGAVVAEDVVQDSAYRGWETQRLGNPGADEPTSGEARLPEDKITSLEPPDGPAL